MAFQVVMLFANGALSIGLYFFIPWLSMALLLDPAGCNSGSLCTTYSDQFYRVNALLGNALGLELVRWIVSACPMGLWAIGLRRWRKASGNDRDLE